MAKLVDKIDVSFMFTQEHEDEKPHIAGPAPGPEVCEMYQTLKEKYILNTYEDRETGLSVSYHLFSPQAPEPGKQYPMVVFIGDASTAGPDPETPLKNCRGALVWATEEEQKKHPCYVLVPQYPEVILDDHGDFLVTPYIELTARLVRSAAMDNCVDPSRICATGQSMGCMTSLILHAEHPDLFAACMFVDGQWEYTELDGLKNRKFLYFAAKGDLKAHEGMSGMAQIWKTAGLDISELTLDAKDPLEKQNAMLSQVLGKGKAINCITWKYGSVLPEGLPLGTIEHMYAFDYAYRLETAREWLLAQRLS